MHNPQPRVNGKFAKGGVVDMVSKGIEAVAKVSGTAGGKAISAADKAVAPSGATKPSLNSGRIDNAIEKAERGYAKGGKVNRHGFEPKAAMSATALAGNGGEETPPAVAATQASTTPVYPTAKPAAPVAGKFRGTPMKRTGAAPSLPYPKRR